MKIKKTIALFMSTFILSSGIAALPQLSEKAAAAPVVTTSTTNSKNSITKTNLDGEKKYYKKNTNITLKGHAPGSNRTVYILKYNSSSKKWDIAKTLKTNSNGNFSYTIKFSKTSKYAASAVSTAKYSSTATYSTEFTTSTSKPKVSYLNIQYSTTVPWQQNHASGYVYNVASNAKPTIELQKKSGKTWKKVKTYSVNANSKFMLNLPKGTKSSKNEKIQYRFVFAGSGVSKLVSNSRTVNWDNPTKGGAQEKKAYGYIKSYCPNTAIIIKKTPSGTWGQAQLGSNTITLNPNITSKHLRTVSLHECGHQQQWKLYGSDWSGFQKKMNKVYGQKGSKGMEQNADCIANYWHKNSYFGYGGNCNGKKGTVAKMIAQGKKY